MFRKVVLIAALLAGCSPDDTDTAQRISDWDLEYAVGMPPFLSADNSFEFPVNSGSVHYVTKLWHGLAINQCIHMRYRIEAESGVEFHPPSAPQSPATIVLYFQRGNDDMSGEGKYETYRWWSTFNSNVLTGPGDYVLDGCFDKDWTAVMTSHALTSPDAFRNALANAEKVGFTFGGGTGWGHGVYATGPAKFTLLEFTVTQ